MPNIGRVLEEQLTAVGIETPQQLRDAGSEAAFIRLRTLDPEACTSKLNALEGAIQGVRWHSLDAQRRAELKEFSKSFRR